MRKLLLNQSNIGILLLLFIFPTSCLKDRITHTYSIQVPVFETLATARANMKSGPATDLKTIGKVYVQGNYIFLNEVDKGIHVIDNSNPSKPVNLSFIKIPGNEDIAVKGSTMYADAYGDLVAFDISNPAHITTKKILDTVFTDRLYYYIGPNNYYYPNSGFNPDSMYVIIDWITKDTTVNYNAYPILYYNSTCPSCAIVPSTTYYTAAAQNNSNGKSGSMARFAVVNDYMYTVSNATLHAFDVSTSDNPVHVSYSNFGWNIETIYPFKNKLFIGSTSGVFIYDIASNPAQPTASGQFSHARACDPVIADDKYAYVTLSDGTKCGGYSNELDIVDATNLNSNSLFKVYPLTHPEGLAKDGSTLFICDGKDGLKVYDGSDALNLKLIGHIGGLETYDIIAENGLAIVVAKDGIYEYDYSDVNHIRQLSKLSVN